MKARRHMYQSPPAWSLIIVIPALLASMAGFIGGQQVQIFTSGQQGAIILSMSRSWIRLGDPPRDTLQLTAKWFDFKTKTEVDITTSATWTVDPATATLVAGLFSSTIAGACTATVQYQGHSKTVRLYVVPQLAPGDTDDDQDGLPDSWERLYSLNPGDQTDWMSDIDNDGLTAMDEYLAGSDPRVGNKDLDGTISADGTISNADRLVWSDANTAASGLSVPLGWVGATRQCVVLWKDPFEVWDACLMVPPDYTYPDFDSSVNCPVSYYSGDRLYFSKQVDCIMDPRALAADIDITFYPNEAYEISCWRGIGRIDISVDPPERITGRLLPDANPSNVRDPGAPLNTILVRNLATWKHFEPYVDPFYTWQYASTPPIFFHFTYSLYRVEFGQVDPPSYSMNNVRIVGFVGDSPPSGTRSLDIIGRLLFSPAIPDNYPPPNQGDKTTIKCRWRFKGQAEWTDWTLDDITLGDVCDDPPPGTTHLLGVHYRYFSFNPVFTDEGIYQFEFFYDADRDGEKDDAEEGIRSAYLLTKLSVYQESNPSNRIFNRTPKEPHDVPTNILYVVADPDQRINVTVRLSKLSGSHGTPIRCAVFHGTTHKMISNDASFDSTGCAKLQINHPGSPDPVDLNIYIGYDTDGDSALDWTEAMILPVVGENLSYIDPRSAVIRASSVSKYTEDSEHCDWASKRTSVYPCGSRFWQLFLDGTPFKRFPESFYPTAIDGFAFDAFAKTDFNANPFASCYSEWLTHNAGAEFNKDGQVTLVNYVWEGETPFSEAMIWTQPFNPQLLSGDDDLLSFYRDILLPIAVDYFKTNDDKSVVVLPLPTDINYPFYTQPCISDESKKTTPAELSHTIGQDYSDDARVAFGRARILYIGRQFKFVKSSEGLDYVARVEEIRVRARIQDLYDYCQDDPTGFIKLGIGIKAGQFGTLQLAYGNGSSSASRARGKIFINEVIGDAWFVIPNNSVYPGQIIPTTR